MPKFQLRLDGEWKDFDGREDEIMKAAFMNGQGSATFHARGQEYLCDFTRMVQRNVKTGKERDIRVVGGDSAPAKASSKPPAAGGMGGPSAVQALHGAAAAGGAGAAAGAAGHKLSGGYVPGRPAQPGYMASPGCYGGCGGGAPPYHAGCGPAAACPPPGYGPPGYGPAGHGPPGYGPPPTYGAPGYGAPAYGAPPPAGAGVGGGAGPGVSPAMAGLAGVAGGLLLGDILF